MMTPHLTIHYNTDDYYQPDEEDVKHKYVTSVDDQHGNTWVFTDSGYWKIPIERAEYIVKAVNAHEDLKVLLTRAAGLLQDYCTELNGDINDSLAMEIETFLKEG